MVRGDKVGDRFGGVPALVRSCVGVGVRRGCFVVPFRVSLSSYTQTGRYPPFIPFRNQFIYI